MPGRYFIVTPASPNGLFPEDFDRARVIRRDTVVAGDRGGTARDGNGDTIYLAAVDKDGNAVPELSRSSWLSIGVPGTVMGLEEALARYGTMKRSAVMAPAIALAQADTPAPAPSEQPSFGQPTVTPVAPRRERAPASLRHRPVSGRPLPTSGAACRV